MSIFLISLSVFAQKPVPLYLRFFPVYFFLLMILDLTVEYTTAHGIHNNILLNTWGPVEFSLYFFVIGQVMVGEKVKKRILYIIIFYAIFAYSNLFFFQHNDLFNPVNFTIGTIITVVLCIYYFFELFQKTEAQSLDKTAQFLDRIWHSF